jgi:hypothetical protein
MDETCNTGENKKYLKIVFRKLKESDHLGDLGADEMTVLQ